MKPVHCRRLLFAGPLIVLLYAIPARADNWPNWRGPNCDGVSRETNLPTEWGPSKNIAWRLTLPGEGGSTPVVWDNHIFLTSEDRNDVALLCISTDGKELWKRKLGNGRKRFRMDEGTNASASPSTDGKHVYAFCGSGDFASFDFDGNEIWKFNAQERYGRFIMQWGTHTSPVLYGDRLYLQLIHSGGAWVIAIDKNTGKQVWKVPRKSNATDECEQAYATPCIWRNGHEAYLVTHGADHAIAYRLEDGSEIWRLGGLNPEETYNPTLRFVASPVASPELIVVPTAKNGPVVGVKPEAKGLVGPGSKFEQWRMPKGTPDVPSPLIHDGLVYLCRENGVLICLDAKTGNEVYNQRLHGGRYRASPLYADGKLYLAARDGYITVVKAGRDFKVLAINKLPQAAGRSGFGGAGKETLDQIAASPVIANGRIYLRGFEALYAIEARAAASAQ
jgi:outer membrane protein assembly factor BamB